MEPLDRRSEGWGAVIAVALLLAVFVVGVDDGSTEAADFFPGSMC